MRRTLVIMLKEPRPGRVKTRLGREIGMTPAAWWFRHQCADLIRRVARDPRWQTILAVSPDRQGMASRVWPRDLQRMPQGSGNLGARMGRLIRGAAPGPVVVIGADIPGIETADLEAAFRALGRSEAVVGPALDGGYWLVGLARRGGRVPLRLFEGVRWSGPHALADTVASMGGLRVAQVRALRDVDRLSDLRAVSAGSTCQAAAAVAGPE